MACTVVALIWRRVVSFMWGSAAPGILFTEAIIMRKLMTTMLTTLVLAGLTIGMVGCTEETGTREQVKIKTRDGTTTETRDVTVKHSGDNPPPAPSEKAQP